jgi:predicted transcriptional regulator
MAMTLRLSPSEDETLARLARQFRMSKNAAAAQAIDLATPRADHPEFVGRSTARLLDRYRTLFDRLAQA